LIPTDQVDLTLPNVSLTDAMAGAMQNGKSCGNQTWRARSTCWIKNSIVTRQAEIDLSAVME